MENKINGKVLKIGDRQEIASKDASKQPFVKRTLTIDSTYYDQFGNKGRDNTPQFEFGGKGLEKLEELVKQGLKVGDIVTITFAVQGDRFTKDGVTKIFNHLRPYDIELFKQGQQPAQDAPATQNDAPQEKADDLPFD